MLIWAVAAFPCRRVGGRGNIDWGRATFAEAATRTMPRKDLDLGLINRLLVLGIGAVASLVVAIIAAAIFGSFWAQ